MSIRNVSASQLAGRVQEDGGASVYFRSGKDVEGPGFMVSDYGSEKRAKGSSPTADEISSYVDEHYETASRDPQAAFGAWGNTMDVSRRVTGGAREARVRSRQNLQEAAYALPGTPLGRGNTPESLGREYGADVLMNLGRTPKAEREAAPVVGVDGPRKRTTTQVPKRPDSETPIYRDMADPSVQADATWARSSSPNEVNYNEVDNDAWSMTNRNNPRSARPSNNYTVGRDDRRRENLGDVLRTINRGRTNEVRGKGLTADPKKGWHPKDAGPSKVGRNTETPGPVDHEALPMEYSTARRATPADHAHEQVVAAQQMHEDYLRQYGPGYLDKLRRERKRS